MGRASVLVVDDEQDISHSLAETLRRDLDAEVTVAGSGDDAWRLVQSGRRFDVVIADLRMPGVDGGTLLTRIGAWDDRICRVLMSAFLEGPTVATLVGAHLFVPKPFAVQPLLNRLQRVCLRRHLRREERAAFR